MTKPKKDPEHCGNCGTQVSSTGPAPRHGQRRYCAKTECRRKKAQELRKVLPTPKRDAAPTVCAGCGESQVLRGKRKGAPLLPPRKWRAGDEFGRFCRKASCRAKRDKIRAEIGAADLVEQKVEIERLQKTIRTLVRMVNTDRVKCPECGLADAVDGYVHQTEEGDPCKGTFTEEVGGDRSLDWQSMLAIVWPPGTRFYGDGY